MKKLILIMLCLITLTGCGNEVKQKPTEPPIKQEEVEVSKYITIKIDVEGKCSTNYEDRDCKIQSYKVLNDKDNIFKDLNLQDEYYCDGAYGTVCKGTAFEKIYDIAIKNNLNFIPDYRYLVDDNYKGIREIILKPLDELKWDGKFNLNENIAIKLNTNRYNEYENYCMITDKEYGKQYVMSRCGIDQGGIKRKISDELINQINTTPGRKYISKSLDKDGLGYEIITINEIVFYYNPRFIKENPKSFYDSKELIDDINKINLYNPFNIGPDIDSTLEKSEVKILDEKICEEYNLTCDRW